MKKLLQNLKNGEISIIEAPDPLRLEEEYLIKTTKTLISTGTEKMMLQFGQANWFNKAKQQPEKVKMVLEKLKSEGIASTFEAVMSRMNEPLEMGYCNVGVVLEGPKNGFKKGTRVVSNGGHSTCVTVNQNLVAAIPDDVTDEQAVFVVPSSIALQGIRLIKPEIGESFG